MRDRKAGSGWATIAALGACLVTSLVHAQSADKASPYLSAFESAAGSKSTSMSVTGKLGGFVLGPNKLVFVDQATQKLWLITTKDGCGRPYITDDGSVVTQEGQAQAETCHFQSIQPINREKLSRILMARKGDADIFGSLPLLGPPPRDISINHMSNAGGTSGGNAK